MTVSVENKATRALRACNLCGWRCGADRTQGRSGPCQAPPLPTLGAWLPHAGEEPPLSGTRGSGAIFFRGCSLRCLFCQNHEISRSGGGDQVEPEALAGIMLELQGEGCHNINLVSPTHFAPQLSRAVEIARAGGLAIPIVYNTHGYDTEEALEWMEGKVDIYLPDVKYADDPVAEELSGIKGYNEVNRRALRAMFAQVGHLREDPASGLATRGLMVRILLLPGGLEGARRSLRWLKEEFSTDLSLSLMAQYTPLDRALARPPLDRPLSREEYEEVVDLAVHLGFARLWLQEVTSAGTGVPDFSARDPFRF